MPSGARDDGKVPAHLPPDAWPIGPNGARRPWLVAEPQPRQRQKPRCPCRRWRRRPRAQRRVQRPCSTKREADPGRLQSPSRRSLEVLPHRFVGFDETGFMFRQALKVFLESFVAAFQVLNERCSIANLDQNATKVTVQSKALGLCFNRRDGALKFGDLIADGRHLLTRRLDFTDDNLQALEFAHGPHGGEAPQERGGCETTSSAAMRERKAVFMTARRSLTRASPKVHERRVPSTCTSCSVLRQAMSARCKAGAVTSTVSVAAQGADRRITPLRQSRRRRGGARSQARPAGRCRPCRPWLRRQRCDGRCERWCQRHG